MLDQYAVIGNPVAHSRSPYIHTAFALQTSQELSYGSILGNIDDFEGDVLDFFEGGGKGLNVTVPFKLRAWRMADVLTPRADLAGAVNTLSLQADGCLLGDNTDGIGLVRDITHNQGFDLADKRVLLLGAGGAARGAIMPILQAGVHLLQIANRTSDKAAALAEMGRSFGPVQSCGLHELGDQQFDIVINATSVSMNSDSISFPASCLTKTSLAYDMFYAAEPTPFCRWAAHHGVTHCIDGLGMLVEQAAESFYLWRNVRPETLKLLEVLRQTLEKDVQSLSCNPDLL